MHLQNKLLREIHAKHKEEFIMFLPFLRMKGEDHRGIFFPGYPHALIVGATGDRRAHLLCKRKRGWHHSRAVAFGSSDKRLSTWWLHVQMAVSLRAYENPVDFFVYQDFLVALGMYVKREVDWALIGRQTNWTTVGHIDDFESDYVYRKRTYAFVSR